MDAWSSPWNDEDGDRPKPSGHSSGDQTTGVSGAPSSLALPSLPSFDAADPWSADVTTPQPTKPDDLSLNQTRFDQGHAQDSSLSEYTASAISLPPVSAWADEAFTASNTADLPNALSGSDAERLPDQDTSPADTEEREGASHDPWAVSSSSDWGAVEPATSAAAATLAHSGFDSHEWGPTSAALGESDGLEARFSSAHLNDTDSHASPFARSVETAGADVGEEKAATNLDVWAAEASSREQKARHLDRDEIDQLKSDARKLIASISTDSETQASFASPSFSQGGWTDLFGSQGSQRDKLHHLQTPPSALRSSSGALRLEVMQSSPTTLTQVRSSIARTENRGIKLVAPDHNASWQRGARPITKAGWLPVMLSEDADGVASNQTPGMSSESAQPRTSGPGWTQTSNSDSRSASGSSFLASFFKGRQTGMNAAGSPDLKQTQTVEAPSSDARSSTSSIRGATSASATANYDPYQDDAGSRYTDDPTGPDLLSLDTPAAPGPSTSSATAAPAAQAQGPGLLNRWRNSGFFKSSAKKSHPSWASASLKGDDLAWLDDQESTDSAAQTYGYGYDEVGEDSFDTFQNRKAMPPPSLERSHASPPPPDPFDALFGPTAPADGGSSASPAAPSSARSSSSAHRASGEGGMMTISTNLGRASSLARKGATSPLQPPPPSQNKRMSIQPPPRVSTASPRIPAPVQSAAQQQSARAASDPFADFLSEAPPKPSAGAKTVTTQPLAASAVKGAAKGNGSGALTADDLLFFDNL